jgi:hypothetical protein
MDPTAIPNKAHENLHKSLDELLCRKAQEAADRALLEQIKIDVLRMDPTLDRKCREFRLGVLLVAASWVGPDIERLVTFTRFPRKFVEAISVNMRACGLWADGTVHTDHWFEGDNVDKDEFWLDCLVADGIMEVKRSESGQTVFRRLVRP